MTKPCKPEIDWVRLDEAEPVLGQRCLIVIPRSINFERRFRIAYYEGSNAFKIVGTGALVLPSHWSPLPDFPKEVEA